MDMVGDVVPSVVRVDTSEGEIAIAVHGGFFQVGPGDGEEETLATVLAGIAEKVSEIDVARAQAAKESAEAEIAADNRNEQATTTSVMARAALERAELRLSAAKA
jgi:F0F1-type ATP synthase epsilon subunit